MGNSFSFQMFSLLRLAPLRLISVGVCSSRNATSHRENLKPLPHSVKNQMPNNSNISQALEECVQRIDLKRGSEIERNLSPDALRDPSIQMNLIRLYSELLFRTIHRVSLTLSV